MSEFAEEKVKKYIRTNLKRFFRIRVAQMLLLLPCLTEMDRQELTAKLAQHGNDQTVWWFFQLLQSRTGWLKALIEALQEDGLEDLASELQDVYDTHLLPAQRNAPPSSSSPAAGSLPPPMGSGAAGFRPPAPPEQVAPPPWDPGSRGAQASPHLLPEHQGAAPLAPNEAEMSSYRAPVQETDETMAEPEATHHPRNLESPTIYAQALPFKISVPSAKENPTYAQPPSAPSASHTLLTQDRLGERPAGALPSTSLPVPPEASASTQKWNSHQQRPVCVKNGYFGNASRVAVDTGASPALVVPLGPKSSGNQPVEDCYLSLDSSPSADPSSQDDSQEEEWLREQKAWGPSHSVKGNSSTFSLHQGDVGRGGAAGQGRNNPTKRDDGEIPAVVRPRNFQGRGVGTNAAAPQLPSSAPQLGSSLSSRSQQPWQPSGKVNVPPNPTTMPPSGFDGVSSTDVIPPSSLPSVPSVTQDFDDLKAPIQERKWSTREDACNTMLTQDKVPGVKQPLHTGDRSTGNPGKRRNSSSWGSRIFQGDDDDDDDGPCKPGVLTSVPGTSAPGQVLDDQEMDRVYSGRSERLCLSSLSGDPLIISDLSQSGPFGKQPPGSALGTVLGRNAMGERGDAPLWPSNANQEVGGSIGTYEVQVKEDASVDLAAAPNVVGFQRCQPRQSSSDCPDLVTERSPMTPANSHREDKANDASPPWIPSDYTLLCVGFALVAVAAVAFTLYKRK